MNLIIDIPKGTYEAVKVGTINQVLEYKVWNAIKNGTLLDKVKAEIADIYCGQYYENPPTADAVREMVLDILDNVGKAESQKLTDDVDFLNLSLEDVIDCS